MPQTTITGLEYPDSMVIFVLYSYTFYCLV